MGFAAHSIFYLCSSEINIFLRFGVENGVIIGEVNGIYSVPFFLLIPHELQKIDSMFEAKLQHSLDNLSKGKIDFILRCSMNGRELA